MLNETITLLYAKTTGKNPTYTRIVLQGVFVDSATAGNASVPMTQTADRAVLLVPLKTHSRYVPAYVYHTLSASEQAKHFTIQVGDVFASGVVTATTSKDIMAQGGFCITTVDEKNTGSALSHLAIGAGRTYRYSGGIA